MHSCITTGAGIAGEGSSGVTIAFTFNRTLNSTEEGSKACERIEVVSEAIEVVYAFASESEPSKVGSNNVGQQLVHGTSTANSYDTYRSPSIKLFAP